ncbi:unnamed protein product [Amoebophrya sp. A25]|nr:unnamed protein product [Amoebophrya sp. A25]|eukprot:GSA25T00015938001.1
MECLPHWSGKGWEGAKNTDRSKGCRKLPDTTQPGWETTEELVHLRKYAAMFWLEFSQPQGSYLLLKVPARVQKYGIKYQSADYAWLCQVQETNTDEYCPFNWDERISTEDKKRGLTQEEAKELSLPKVGFEVVQNLKIIARVDVSFARSFPQRPTAVRLNDSDLVRLLEHCAVQDDNMGSSSSLYEKLQAKLASRAAAPSSGPPAKRKKTADRAGGGTGGAPLGSMPATAPSSSSSSSSSSSLFSSSSSASLLPSSSPSSSSSSSSALSTTEKIAGSPLSLADLLEDIFDPQRTKRDGGRIVQKDLRQTQDPKQSAGFGATTHNFAGCTMTAYTQKLKTKEGEYVCPLLTGYLNDRQGEIKRVDHSAGFDLVVPGAAVANAPEVFSYSSISVHKNAGTVPHIDGGNLGPSVVLSFGNFQGGGTYVVDTTLTPRDLDFDLPRIHEPMDNRAVAIEVPASIAENENEKKKLWGRKTEKWPSVYDMNKLKEKKKPKRLHHDTRYFICAREFDTKAKPVMFDAAREVHGTMPWTGDRFALVYFTHSSLPGLRTRRNQGVDAFRAFLLALQDMGFPLPPANSAYWREMTNYAEEVVDLASSDEDE